MDGWMEGGSETEGRREGGRGREGGKEGNMMTLFPCCYLIANRWVMPGQ